MTAASVISGPSPPPVPCGMPAAAAPLRSMPAVGIILLVPWSLAQQRLKGRNRIRKKGRVSPSLHRKAKRSIQARQIIGPKTFGLAFPETEPRHAFAILDLIVERDRISSNVRPAREALQPLLDGKETSRVDRIYSIQRIRK